MSSKQRLAKYYQSDETVNGVDKNNTTFKFPPLQNITLLALISLIGVSLTIIPYAVFEKHQKNDKENFFDPCEFPNMLPLSEIVNLKAKINIYQMKIDNINDLLICSTVNACETKLQNVATSYRNTFNTLQENLQYQKIHRKKCYRKNLQILLERNTLIIRIVDIVVISMIVFFNYVGIFHPKDIYDFKQTKNEKILLSIFVTFLYLVVCFMIFRAIYCDFIFPPDSGSVIEDIPIF